MLNRGLRVYPYPRVYNYPTRTRVSGTGKVITGTMYPVLPVPTFSFGVTLSSLDVAVNLTAGHFNLSGVGAATDSGQLFDSRVHSSLVVSYSRVRHTRVGRTLTHTLTRDGLLKS